MAENEPMTNDEFKKTYGRNIGEYHPVAGELLRDIPWRKKVTDDKNTHPDQSSDIQIHPLDQND
jgi:hypothetical protein